MDCLAKSAKSQGQRAGARSLEREHGTERKCTEQSAKSKELEQGRTKASINLGAAF